MTEVLMISKPMAPPYDDSGKNIVLSQLRHGRDFKYRVMGTRSSPPPFPGVAVDPVYSDTGAFSPALTQNLRAMWRGLFPRGSGIYHYFFAPNRVSSAAGRAQLAWARVKSVHTICSRPLSFEGISKFLFADRVIVLSEDTENRMTDAGVPRAKLVRVRPGIDPIDSQDDSARRAIRLANGLPETSPVVLFPGDYEFSSAAATVAAAVPLISNRIPDSVVVFACRIKRDASRAIRDSIRGDLERAGFQDRVVFLERVENMPSLAGAADVVVMPAESLYAKMDVPLVLLEAMSQSVPVVLSDVPPLLELLACGCGAGVPPGNPEALADAVVRILEDRGLSSRLGGAGEAAVREIYSASAMARAVEKVYKEVLEGD